MGRSRPHLPSGHRAGRDTWPSHPLMAQATACLSWGGTACW